MIKSPVFVTVFVPATTTLPSIASSMTMTPFVLALSVRTGVEDGALPSVISL